MDMKKELELIELRAQVSLLYELLHEFELWELPSIQISSFLIKKQEQITELEKQIQNETNV